MNVVVMGSGGVGGYFGGRLARAGQSVTFVARGPHLEAIRREGLRVRSAVEGEYVVKADAVDRLDGRPRADLILLCVKAFDTDAALRALQPVVGPETVVLSLQNGVESADRIKAVLGPGHALGGVAYVFAAIEAPALIVHRAAGRIALGELDGRLTPRSQRVCETFAAADVPADLSTEIQQTLWEKYVFICAQAAVTAVTRAPIGTARAVPETWRLYRRLVEEGAALAAAAGVPLGADIVDRTMAAASALPPEATSSLAYDLARGRRLEVEGLHGYAVRLGERLDVSTPALFAMYAALKPHADGNRTR